MEAQRHCNDNAYIPKWRLVGTLYFKKHLSAFISRGYETPQHLFHSLEEASPLDQHQQWLENIRGTIGERITSEVERACTLSWGSLETLAEILLGVQNVG